MFAFMRAKDALSRAKSDICALNQLYARQTDSLARMILSPRILVYIRATQTLLHASFMFSAHHFIIPRVRGAPARIFRYKRACSHSCALKSLSRALNQLYAR